MPDEYGNPTGRDWVGLGRAIREGGEAATERKNSDLVGSYLNAMKQGKKIDVNSDRYFAPAHLAAGTMLHKEKMQDAKYAGQLYDNDKKELELKYQQDVIKLDKFMALPDDQLESAFLEVDQLVNGNGDDYTGTERGEDGKIYYVGTNAAGSKITSKVPAYSPEQIREIVGRFRNPEEYFKMRMQNKAQKRAWNDRALTEPEHVIDKEGNEAYLYQVKDDTGNIQKYAITRQGQRIEGKELSKYQPFDDYKDKLDADRIKSRTRANDRIGKGGDITPAQRIKFNKQAYDKVEDEIAYWEEFNGKTLTDEQKQRIRAEKVPGILQEWGVPPESVGKGIVGALQTQKQQGKGNQGYVRTNKDGSHTSMKKDESGNYVEKKGGYKPGIQAQAKTKKETPPKEKQETFKLKEIPEAVEREVKEGLKALGKELKKGNGPGYKAADQYLQGIANKKGNINADNVNKLIKIISRFNDKGNQAIRDIVASLENKIGNIKTPFKKES